MVYASSPALSLGRSSPSAFHPPKRLRAVSPTLSLGPPPASSPTSAMAASERAYAQALIWQAVAASPSTSHSSFALPPPPPSSLTAALLQLNANLADPPSPPSSLNPPISAVAQNPLSGATGNAPPSPQMLMIMAAAAAMAGAPPPSTPTPWLGAAEEALTAVKLQMLLEAAIAEGSGGGRGRERDGERGERGGESAVYSMLESMVRGEGGQLSSFLSAAAVAEEPREQRWRAEVGAGEGERDRGKERSARAHGYAPERPIGTSELAELYAMEAFSSRTSSSVGGERAGERGGARHPCSSCSQSFGNLQELVAHRLLAHHQERATHGLHVAVNATESTEKSQRSHSRKRSFSGMSASSGNMETTASDSDISSFCSIRMRQGGGGHGAVGGERGGGEREKGVLKVGPWLQPGSCVPSPTSPLSPASPFNRHMVVGLEGASAITGRLLGPSPPSASPASSSQATTAAAMFELQRAFQEASRAAAVACSAEEQLAAQQMAAMAAAAASGKTAPSSFGCFAPTVVSPPVFSCAPISRPGSFQRGSPPPEVLSAAAEMLRTDSSARRGKGGAAAMEAEPELDLSLRL